MNYIFGSSGFGKEVLWILQQHNLKNIFFVDIREEKEEVNGIKVINQQDFKNLRGTKRCFIAVGSPEVRKKIYENIKDVPDVEFPNIADPSVRQYEKYNAYGVGNIICAGAILTTNIQIGNFNHFNLNTTVGHDAVVKNFCTFSPGSNISGCVNIEDNCFFGTNCVILENINVSSNIIIGAGAVVTKNLMKSGTYIGIPAKLRS